MFITNGQDTLNTASGSVVRGLLERSSGVKAFVVLTVSLFQGSTALTAIKKECS